MARIDVPDGDGLEAGRLFKLAPHIGEGLAAWTTAVYEKCTIPVREREAMRMRIAQLNQCHV